MSLHYTNPVSVQVLRKADKSPVLKPYVIEAREFLIEIFGAQKTKKALSTTKHVTKEVAITAEYSAIFAFVMLAILFIALNILIYQRRWVIYTVQSNDSLEAMLSRCIMTESALIRANPALKTPHKNTEKIVLLPGQIGRAHV